VKNPTERGHRPARESAFTLLEVLAAVAILGLWFAVLANVAIQGLRSEGQNERRIRASLIADRVLTDVELGFDLGELPGENVDVQEEEEFTIEVEQLPITGLELAGAEGELTGLLETEAQGVTADLYTVHVRVSWIEGAQEQAVHRTTYVWDMGPLMEQLGQLPSDEEGAEGDEEGAEVGDDEAEGAPPR